MAKKQAAKKKRMQVAALPYQMEDGHLRVLLVTSRETRRWILPKGWTEKDLDGPGVAALEAYEEAGVRGVAAPKPIGSYQYFKRLSTGRTVPCDVKVYALEVREELEDWPEAKERQRRWMSPSQAALHISETGLVDLLLRLGMPTVD
ncbi:NUDIX hydrolase [Rhodocista pekingensis]|uniref:NUDIX hydrolase n=1 Tax=Rhodocista pekingensis TaxID=201185 RepID=A0ABW2KZC4_9PROT